MLLQDRNPDNQTVASENFKQISQAYDVLSYPKKKQIYGTVTLCPCKPKNPCSLQAAYPQ